MADQPPEAQTPVNSGAVKPFSPTPIGKRPQKPRWRQAIAASVALSIFHQIVNFSLLTVIGQPWATTYPLFLELIGRAATPWFFAAIITGFGILRPPHRDRPACRITELTIFLSGLVALLILASAFLNFAKWSNGGQGAVLAPRDVEFIAANIRQLVSTEIDQGVTLVAVETDGTTLRMTARMNDATQGSAAKFVADQSAGGITGTYCTDTELRSLIDEGLIVEVIYIVADNTEITTREASRESCAGIETRHLELLDE